MSTDDAVTQWIHALQNGEASASHQIWDKYFSRLCRVARKKLPQYVTRDFDEEDIALSAMDCLYRGIEEGRFTDLQHRGNLWSLLILITSRKISHRLRDRSAQKRGGGQSLVSIDQSEMAGISDVLSKEPSPDFISEMNEEAITLLEILPSPEIRQVAELKIAGYSNQEIARSLSCGKRTVERRLMIIRQTWIDHGLEGFSETSSS